MLKNSLLLFAFIILLSSFEVFLPQKEIKTKRNNKKTIDTLSKVVLDLNQLKEEINANN
jgi:hypothetical protein